MQFWIPLALVLGALSCPVPTAPEPPQAPAFREDWITKDVERARQLLSVIDADGLDVDTLRRALSGADVREDRKIGFGARRVVLAVYGGYTTLWIHVLATDPERESEGPSRVADLRCDQVGPREHEGTVVARLKDVWGSRATSIERGMRAERHDETAQVALRAKRDAALGRIETPVFPETLRASYELLVSPFESLALGQYLGEDGGPPPGSAAAHALLDARRVDLLRVALRGWNPEGRAWAAWALHELAKSGLSLAAEDRRVIEALRGLPLELRTCRGCLLEDLRFDAALAVIAE